MGFPRSFPAVRLLRIFQSCSLFLVLLFTQAGIVSLAAQTASKTNKPNKQKTPLQELQEHYDAGRTYQ